MTQSNHSECSAVQVELVYAALCVAGGASAPSPQVNALAGGLTENGFRASRLMNTPRGGVGERLQTELAPGFLAGPGSRLIVWWAGDGVTNGQPTHLTVEVQEHRREEAFSVTVEEVMAFAAAAAAEQTLLVFDLQFEGHVDLAEKTASVMRRTRADAGWSGVLIAQRSADKPSRSLTEVMTDLLIHGPTDPALRQRWTRGDAVHANDVVDALVDEYTGRLHTRSTGAPGPMLRTPIKLMQIMLRSDRWRTMSDGSTFAFVSYVREDAEPVGKISQALTNMGVPLWRDATDLLPGTRWRTEIRRAIKQGAAFVAFFSVNSEQREISYMREELLEAIGQMRLRSRDHPWFIPVRLDSCSIPSFDIGPGETLSDLQYLDLMDPYDEQAVGRLAAAIRAASTSARQE